MNKNDLMFFSFITLWILLTAGKPDLIDAIVHVVMESGCHAEVKKSE